jgi:hypothetical protein
MHLDYTRSVYKGKTYISYRIAESVRTGDKVSKRILLSLGQLSPLQVKQIKLILHTLKDPNEVLVALSQVVPTRAVPYLDLAVANYYWDHWQLDLAFAERTESTLSTERVARILTLNRCIDPCSHYSVPRWVKRTALPEILGVDLQGLNDDKIYYELDRIEENKSQIQDHLLEITKSRSPESYEFVNYDLSTAYFVGIRCSLSRYGRGKDNQPYCRQVVLALLVNSQGYPFKWDVFPGNQAEVHTLEENVAACKSVGLDAVTMVFDRGLVSKKNLEMLSATEGVKFISALDKSQIPKAPGVNLRPFAKLPEKGLEAQLRMWPKFKRFEESVFFRDLGVIDGRRYVLSINGNLLREERKLRRQKLRQFASFLKAYNEDLRNAQRDRSREPTVRAVVDKLRRLKIARLFEDPVVRPITVRHKRKDGTRKPIASFQIKLKRKDAAIREAKLLDGVCVFISDHVEKRGRGYAMNARQMVQAYRDKTEIEDAFKNMKSFVKIRPFFVNTEEHVRAVFTVCVLSYHLNKTLARARKEIEGKDFLNSNELYDPFVDCKMVTMKDPHTGTIATKVIPPSSETKSLLKSLGLSHLIRLHERRM